ncbi:MAG: hypothetical protein OXP69_10360 [Spirochaetaceae bacterium]|nr:hypothetical protein [Spirochaetaceae bacterium]
MWLRVRAAEQDRSVSRWLVEMIEGIRRDEGEYEVAMERFLAGARARAPRRLAWRRGNARAGKSCMTGQVFVETNVFVYLHDDAEPERSSGPTTGLRSLVNRRACRLSFQTLQELRRPHAHGT